MSHTGCCLSLSPFCFKTPGSLPDCCRYLNCKIGHRFPRPISEPLDCHGHNSVPHTSVDLLSQGVTAPVSTSDHRGPLFPPFTLILCHLSFSLLSFIFSIQTTGLLKMGLSFEGVVEEELLLCMVSPPTPLTLHSSPPACEQADSSPFLSPVCLRSDRRGKKRCDLWTLTVGVGFLSLSWDA